MAKVQVSNYEKKRVKRKGVHAKTKTSKNKDSCGKYMELSNPKSGAPSFRSNRWGQVY